MGGGYKPPSGDSAEPIVREFSDLRRQARDGQRPGGTRIGQLYAQVQETLANIVAMVASAASDWMTANAYTKLQVDSLVASPGNISPGTVTAGGSVSSAGSVSAAGDVSAGGRVISAGILNSPGSKAYTVVTGYSAVYIDSAGDLGGNTSSRRFKQDIIPVVTDVPGLLGLTTYRFRYIAAVEQLGDEAPWEFGLIAEDVVEVAPWACFYEPDGVTVRGINYDRLVVALLNVVQDHERRLTDAGL